MRAFDTSTFWQDQEKVTIFHGTSRDNAHGILNEGLQPSRQGYTTGKSFFTTSPFQASLYAQMGGEVNARGKTRVPESERIVLAFQVPSEMLVPNSLWLKDRERFQIVDDWLQDDPDFDPMGEFYTKHAIPPEMIVQSQAPRAVGEGEE